MMLRKHGWQKALIAVAERYRNAPFEWGATDCAHFAADCVLATTGVDVMGSFRGNYEGRLTAAARLNHRNYNSVAEAAAAALEACGAVEIDPRAARLGDIGVTLDDVLAVRFAPGFIARDELGKFKQVRAVRAWGVGQWRQ